MINIAWNDNLAAKLRKNKIQQNALAEKLGVSKVYVSQILNGASVSEKNKQLFIDSVDELIKEKKQGAIKR